MDLSPAKAGHCYAPTASQFPSRNYGADRDPCRRLPEPPEWDLPASPADLPDLAADLEEDDTAGTAATADCDAEGAGTSKPASRTPVRGKNAAKSPTGRAMAPPK